MKAFLSSMFCLLVVVSSYAQITSEHMTFKGIPIDSTLNTYVVQMKKSGFSYITTEDKVAILQGDFAG